MKNSQFISLIKEYPDRIIIGGFTFAALLILLEPTLGIVLMGQLLAGLAVVVAAWMAIDSQNSPENIKNKKREETLQQVKVDSVLEAIEKVNKFKTAFKKTRAYILDMSARIDIKYSGGETDPASIESSGKAKIAKQRIADAKDSDDIKWMLNVAHVALKDDFSKEHIDIEEFIFSLEKDIIINGNDERLKKSIDKIEKLHGELQNIFYIEIEKIQKKAENKFNDKEKYKKAVLDELDKIIINDISRIKVSVDKISKEILEICKGKLESE